MDSHKLGAYGIIEDDVNGYLEMVDEYLAGNGVQESDVGYGALVKEHVRLRRQLWTKQAQSKALKEHVDWLVKEKEALGKCGKLSLDRLIRHHNLRMDELAVELKIVEEKTLAAGSAALDPEAPEYQLAREMEKYDREYQLFRYGERIRVARKRYLKAMKKLESLKNEIAGETKNIKEDSELVNRYQKLGYVEFVVDSLNYAKMIQEGKKNLAKLLVENAKLSEVNDAGQKEKEEVPI